MRKDFFSGDQAGRSPRRAAARWWVCGGVRGGAGRAGVSAAGIRNVNVIAMTAPEVLRDRNVVIRDGAIVSIEESTPARSAALMPSAA